MEVYKRETEAVLDRYCNRELHYNQCVAALDAALASVIDRTGELDIEDVRRVMRQAHRKALIERDRRIEASKASSAVAARNANR
jgi:hypothetical protein